MLDKIRSFNNLVNLIESFGGESKLNLSLFNEIGFIDSYQAKKDLIKFGQKYGFEIVNFMMALYIYQSSYLYVDPNKIYALYMKLSPEIKKRYTPNERQLQNARRGDDAVQHKKALSFMVGDNVEKVESEITTLFGAYIFAIEDLKSYDGIFSTPELHNDEKYADLIQYLNLGDDENEIIVFGGKWKKEVYSREDKEMVDEIYSLILSSPRTPDIKKYVYDVLNKKNPIMPDSVADNIIKDNLSVVLDLMEKNIQIPQSIFEAISKKSKNDFGIFARNLIFKNLPISPIIYGRITQEPDLLKLYREHKS